MVKVVLAVSKVRGGRAGGEDDSIRAEKGRIATDWERKSGTNSALLRPG